MIHSFAIIFFSRPSLPLNKKRYSLQNVDNLRKPRLIPQTLF